MSGRGTRAPWRVVVAAVATVAAWGCGGCAAADGEPPLEFATPPGEVLTIEPRSLAGAERLEFGEISILVPDGWQVREGERDEYEELVITDPQDERNPVYVTLPNDADRGREDRLRAEALSKLAMGNLLLAATDVEEHPVRWEGWEFALGVTATLDRGDGDVVDLLVVTALSRSGSVVKVTAMASTGSLTGSPAEQVLSSMQDVS
ncbi:hypothetical protein [Xylanimonas ulmi]|uniref:Lipoprotein LpqN n=1 Tax=Xylanimonas ulmi TaxID=228973 RepID=A0A4Q7M8U4_9MICO|nr:hypothetical protein [Xylanibacterium ulmi]RZS63092.1 hypothetical protein EV386_3450 [Xylanibacterium ulmi]